jgi:prepilin-type N-terminal cleavage/methylation domain-containing protein
MFVMFDLKSNVNRVAQARHGFLRFLALNEPLSKSTTDVTPKVTPKVTPARHHRNKSAGFTMLELLVVIALLGVVAIASMTIIIDTKDIESLDATEKRWDQIRYAIIGDTSRSLNNEPMMSGYVADMGRLPNSIRELMTREYLYDHDDNPNTPQVLFVYDHDDNGATPAISVQQPTWQEFDLYKYTATANCTLPNQCAKFGSGWRGPYIYTAGSDFFRDGWSNFDSEPNNDARTDNDNIDDDLVNFGWSVTQAPNACIATNTCEDFGVTSLGSRNDVGGTGFNEDFPLAGMNVVNANDWLYQATTLSFNVRLSRALATDVTDLTLRIYYFADDNNSATAPSLTFVDSALFNVAAGTQTLSVTVTPPDDLSLGKYAAVIYCDTTNSYVFDVAACDATNNNNPVIFNLLPNTSTITIPWNLP